MLADLQNTVPNQHTNNVQNGTPGYGCLKGARRKEPQVVRFFTNIHIYLNLNKFKLPFCSHPHYKKISVLYVNVFFCFRIENLDVDFRAKNI